MKYKCNSCEHIFEGSSYSIECPECESKSIVPYKSDKGIIRKVMELIKENKLTSSFLAVILILILFKGYFKSCEDLNMNGICDEKESNKVEMVYSLGFKMSKDYLTVLLLDSNNVPQPYSSLYNFLDLSATIITDNNDLTIIIDGNKIPFCAKGELEVNYIKNSNRLVSTRQSGFYKPVSDVDPENPSTKCIEGVEINSVSTGSDDCRDIIIISKTGGDIMVSVNGKNGDYRNSLFFSYPSISDFDIWFFPRGYPKLTKHFKGDVPELISSSQNSATNDEKAIVKKKFESIISNLLNEACEEIDWNNYPPEKYGYMNFTDNLENFDRWKTKIYLKGNIEKPQRIISALEGLKDNDLSAQIILNDCAEVKQIIIK